MLIFVYVVDSIELETTISMLFGSSFGCYARYKKKQSNIFFCKSFNIVRYCPEINLLIGWYTLKV